MSVAVAARGYARPTTQRRFARLNAVAVMRTQVSGQVARRLIFVKERFRDRSEILFQTTVERRYQYRVHPQRLKRRIGLDAFHRNPGRLAEQSLHVGLSGRHVLGLRSSRGSESALKPAP